MFIQPKARTLRIILRLLPLVALAGCASRPKIEIKPPAWVGINSMLGFPDFNGTLSSAKATPQEREQGFALLSELGSPPVRDLVMSWARVQPRQDAEYDFSLSDELVRQAQQRQIDLLALCLGTPGWASGSSSAPAFDFGVPALKHEKAFRSFVRAFVERYNGDGREDMPELERPLHTYEFLQEMEDIPPQEYAYWLRVFYESVHEADPQAIVSVGSLRTPGLAMANEPAGDDPTYLERLLADSSLVGPSFPYFDAVSFHSYPDSYPGHRPFDESLAYIRKTLAARGISKPVWLTEYGCRGEPADEARQAAVLVQWTLHARALGLDRAYIYCLWDHHWGSPQSPPESLGLVRESPTGAPPLHKPAFEGVETLLRELRDRPNVTRHDENLYVLSGGTGESTFAVWRDAANNPDQKFVDAGWWDVRTLDGRKSQQQGIDIRLGPMPMFVQKIESPFLKKSPFQKERTFPFKEIEELNEKAFGPKRPHP